MHTRLHELWALSAHAHSVIKDEIDSTPATTSSGSCSPFESSLSLCSLSTGSQVSINHESNHECEESSLKRKRENTVAEKRRMRNQRKKRLKKRKRPVITAKHLKRELAEAQRKVGRDELKLVRLTAMARSYWERWRWELQKRKEALLTSIRLGMQLKKQTVFPNR